MEATIEAKLMDDPRTRRARIKECEAGSMTFVICGRELRVRIAAEELILDGKACWGTFDGRDLISLAHDLPPSDRRRILFHELRHAWMSTYGQRASDDEADANDVAAFADEMARQLEAQGGELALRLMQPDFSGLEDQLRSARVREVESQMWRKRKPAIRLIEGPGAY